MRVKNQKTSDTITIYWTPAPFDPEEESWNMLYQDPKPLIESIYENSYDNATIRRCPATRSSLKNVFSINSCHSDSVEFTNDILKHVDEAPDQSFYIEHINSILGLSKARASEYPGHVNIKYNMSWHFFASEPVEAKMTSPYYPPVSPTPGSTLYPGQFDIGLWYRPFNLEYSIPIDSKKFTISSGDPLFYLEIKTDKKVIFKRYVNTKKLSAISREVTDTKHIYGKDQPLKNRYLHFSRSKLPEIVLNEISKNIIDSN